MPFSCSIFCYQSPRPGLYVNFVFIIVPVPPYNIFQLLQSFSYICLKCLRRFLSTYYFLLKLLKNRLSILSSKKTLKILFYTYLGCIDTTWKFMPFTFLLSEVTTTFLLGLLTGILVGVYCADKKVLLSSLLLLISLDFSLLSSF